MIDIPMVIIDVACLITSNYLRSFGSVCVVAFHATKIGSVFYDFFDLFPMLHLPSYREMPEPAKLH